MLREAELDARRLLDATQTALHDDGDALLQPREQFDILVAMQTVADLLAQCAEGEGETLGEREGLRLSLRAATDQLNHATTPFAGKRMNARVRGALAGRRVDQLAA
jgi:molecular chaperone HscA